MSAKRQQTQMGLGDVFVKEVAAGLYGAVRVLQGPKSPLSSKAWMVAMCDYLGKDYPKINDDRLRKILKENRFHFSNEQAIIWLGGKPPKSFVKIGTIPPTNVEAKMLCNTFGFWGEQ